jgi:hypothetical protein
MRVRRWEAAVDVDDVAGGERQQVARDRQDRLGHVLGLAPAPDRGEAVGDQRS